jgi:sugar lactone lactonase YvrE
MPRNTQHSTRTKCRRLLLIVLLALAALPSYRASAATIVYVKPGGTGGGTSWADAADLQAVLNTTISGIEIWVAKGTYTPAITNQAASFHLRSDVAIYGGFSGTESQRSQRNIAGNLTILSGDLLGNDSGAPTFNNPTRTDNSYHVVRSASIGSTVILDGVTIRGGNANGACCTDDRGGGLYNTSSSPTLTNVTFSANSASGTGGGLYNDSSSPTLTNVTFSANSAQVTGGGLTNSSSSPTLANVTFNGNFTNDFGNGGGLYNNNSSPTLTNVTFSGNSATWGGGLYNTSSSPTLTNVTFSTNSTNNGGDGGGLHNHNSNPTLTNVTFSANSAIGGSGEGGGLYNNNSSPTLTNVTFSANFATANGGGMSNVGNSSPTLTNVTFSSNSATVEGGGLSNSGSNPTLTNVTFSANSATVEGGGMKNRNSNPTLTNVTFSANYANSTGGGLSNSGSDPTLTNVTFSGNSARFAGGGIDNYSSSSPTLTNVTISGNIAATDANGSGGGGIFNDTGSTAALRNTIVAGNSSPLGGPDCKGSLSTDGYNLIGNNGGCTFAATTGDRVGTAGSPLDPKLGPLQDNGGFAPTRALLAGSPALDVIPSGASGCGTTVVDDQRGTPRPQGGRCDIGAYEVVPPNLASTTAGSGAAGFTNGPKATARFDTPSGVAASADGDLALIADAENHAIRKVNVPIGLVSTLAGNGSPGSANGIGSTAQFSQPLGVALNAAGTLALVADTGNQLIRRIDVPSGTVTTLAGRALTSGSADGYTATARFNLPVGIAIDAGGTVALVSDYQNHTIRKIDLLTGLVSTLAGKAGVAGAQDGVGASARFKNPSGVALSADGAFALVVDTGNNTIRKVEVANGRVTTLATLGTAANIRPAFLDGEILGIAMDADGCTGMIANSARHTITKVDVATGKLSPIAGNSGNPGSANGSGANARFNTPQGVALTNGSSTALVADTQNNTVRRVDGIAPPKCQRVFLPLARR